MLGFREHGFGRIGAVLAVLFVTGGLVAVLLTRRTPAVRSASVWAPAPAGIGIAASGRIEPEDGLVQVTAPYISGRPSLVRSLKVKQGDQVQAGQTLAILDSNPILEASWRQAQAQADVARSRLAQVKAGARPGDLEAQRKEIARWQAELENAEAEYRRYEKLHGSEDVTTQDLEAKRLARDRARQMLMGAQERLGSLAEVRGTDVKVAEAELLAAEAEEQRSRTELASTTVRAPFDGRVIRILARPGEDGSTRGILELARTNRMYAVAEIYETDIGRVKLGQKAVITSELIQGKLEGSVTEIGMKVGKSEILPLDPASYADHRVVKVRVLLSDGARVASLIDGKVSVVIQP